MGARETFEQAAAAARRLVSVTAELESMDESWRRGEWLVSASPYGGHSDPTASRAGYVMARGKALEAERVALNESLAEAQALVDGIGKLLGQSHADVLRYRCLECRQWSQVVNLLGVSESTARNRMNVSMNTIDALGPTRVKEARGMATC